MAALVRESPCSLLKQGESLISLLYYYNLFIPMTAVTRGIPLDNTIFPYYNLFIIMTALRGFPLDNTFFPYVL